MFSADAFVYFACHMLALLVDQLGHALGCECAMVSTKKSITLLRSFAR